MDKKKESEKLVNDWTDKKVGDVLSWIANYFVGNGQYIVCNGNTTIDEWMQWTEEKDLTANELICIAVEYGYLKANLETKKNSALDNLLCGRSSKKQAFYDKVIDVMLKH